VSQTNDLNPVSAGPPTVAPGGRLEDPRVIRVVEEYLAALEAGYPPDRRALQTQHPEIAEPLGRCLDALEFVQTAGSQLQPSAGAPEASDRIPFTHPLGDFQIVREVGRGGMGVVYEAMQLSLGRRVALKVLPFAATLDPKQLQRFKNEAQAAAQLHHTNIVPILGVGSERGVHYYAMQFIEGRTLAALIGEMRQLAGLELTTRPDPSASAAGDTVPRAGPATVQSVTGPAHFRSVAHFGVQAAEALEHAHQLGVIHRDIKPANLLVDGRNNLWVTDFGLAHCRGQAGLTLTGDLVGTLRYMSPEQALARRALIDHRTDVYSLGTVLYECLTLEPALPGRDREEMLRQMALEEPPRPRRRNPAVPAELETIVRKAMEKNPDDRYATAQELADDLRRFLEDKPIRAQPPTLWQRARKWARRHQAVVRTVLAFGVLATVGLVLGVVLLWQERERTREALAEAKAHYEAELEQRQQAEINYQMAREAVERYFTQVSQSKLLNVPGLQPLRQELLRTARDFYDEFVKQRGDDPKAQAELAYALMRLAFITSAVDSKAKAVAFYQRALALHEKLAPAYAAKPQYHSTLAATHHSLGMLYRTMGKMSEADAALEKALEIRQRLARDFPTVTAYQTDLGITQLSRGLLYASIGEAVKAESAYLQALQALEKPAPGQPADANRQSNLANCYHNLGALYIGWGRSTEAAAAFQKSLAIKNDLVNAFPADPNYQSDLAATHLNLGALYNNRAEKDKAEAAFRQALALHKQLTQAHPAVTDYQSALAANYLNLGSLYQERGQTTPAEQNYHGALQILEKLAASQPAVPEFRNDLALAHRYLGILYRAAGKKALAKAALQKALALQEALVQAFPKRAEYALLLSITCCALGNLLMEEDQGPAALDWFGRAIRTAEGATELDKYSYYPRETLANAYFERASALSKLCRFEEALRDWDRAVDAAQGPQAEAFRLHRAILLVRMGRHDQATAEATRLVENKSVTGATWYNAGCLFSLSSAAALRDDQLAPVDRERLAEQYAVRAVELLAKAQAAGFFAIPAKRETLKKDPDLEALRARDDFKKWLAGLGK
jgi:serine/threonine protein kinase